MSVRTETAFADYPTIRGQWQELLAAPDAVYRRDAPDYVQERLAVLAMQTPREHINASDGNFQGFIGPATRLYPGIEGINGLVLDDVRLYRAVASAFRAPVSPLINQATSFTARAISAAQRTTDQYFGAPPGQGGLDRRDKLLFSKPGSNGVANDGTLSIKALRRIAACAERAAGANNVLHILGQAPVYEMGTVQAENRSRFPHAFLVIASDDAHLIYDPSNPALVQNRRSRIIGLQPALYEADPIVVEERMIEVGGLLHTHKQRPRGPVIYNTTMLFMTHYEGRSYKPV